MARVKHVAHSQSVGTAAIFLLAAAGVAGNRPTGRLILALVAFVMFAVLMVAGMRVAYLVERSASAPRPDEAGAERSTAGQADRIDLRGTQAVQTGDYNRQRNGFSSGRKPGLRG